jgi:hypothetical protein
MIRVVYGNNDGHRISALALLDSQCEFDMISTRCAARLGLNYKNAPREHLANTITGNRVYKVGEVWIRWCLEEGVRLSSSDEEITFSRRFEEARFLVVDSELFDVIIGHPTLVSLDLYAQQKNLVAPFRTLASKVSSSASDTAAEQRDFEKRMEKERLRMEEAERRRVRTSSVCQIGGWLTIFRLLALLTTNCSPRTASVFSEVLMRCIHFISGAITNSNSLPSQYLPSRRTKTPFPLPGQTLPLSLRGFPLDKCFPYRRTLHDTPSREAGFETTIPYDLSYHDLLFDLRSHELLLDLRSHESQITRITLRSQITRITLRSQITRITLRSQITRLTLRSQITRLTLRPQIIRITLRSQKPLPRS